MNYFSFLLCGSIHYGIQIGLIKIYSCTLLDYTVVKNVSFDIWFDYRAVGVRMRRRIASQKTYYLYILDVIYNHTLY